MYNNIYVQLPRTVEFKMEAEYDPSHTDVLWHKYSVRVRGFVNRTTGQFDNVSTGALLASLKASLETPRVPCLYSINGSTVISVGVAGGVGGAAVGTRVLDAHLGPEPQPATVRAVDGNVFMVECGFVVRVVDCIDERPLNNPIVSMRWTQAERFSETWHSRVTTSGRLIVRSDMMFNGGFNADAFRGTCTPGIMNGYIRTDASYTLAPDGTALDFSFVDEEKDCLPPTLAVKASGSFVVAVTSGALRTGVVTVRLQGPPGNTRRDLLQKAILIGHAKLEADGFLTTPPIINGTFKEELYENIVEIRMEARLSSLASAGGPVGGGGGPNVTGAIILGTAGFFLGGPLGAAAGGAIGANLPAGGGGGGGGGGAWAVVAAALRAAGVIPPVAAGPLLQPGFTPLEPGPEGIAPTVRRRLAAMLSAAFADPCAELTASVRTPMPPLGPDNDFGGGGADFGGDTPITNPATISIAPLPEIPPGPVVIADVAPYESYVVHSTYIFTAGKVLMPGTGVGPRAGAGAFVTVHGGMMSLVVVWTAERQGFPPVLPSFESNDPNIVPLEGTITTEGIDYDASLTSPTFSVSGKYVYGIADPSAVSITAPTPPFLSDQAAQAGMSAALAFNDQVLWRFNATSSGGNPFATTGFQVGQQPNANVFAELGTAVAGNLIGAYQAIAQQPDDLGLQASAGSSSTSPVNP